jgi:hypothetical protein
MLQLPVVQPFPGGKEDEEEIMAVISLAALSQHLLTDPDIIEAPVIRFASQKVRITCMCAYTNNAFINLQRSSVLACFAFLNAVM